MAKTLYLMTFKNYSNREIEIPGNNYEAYTQAGYTALNIITNMTLWNPNDGINTVINTTWFTDTIPNYVLVTPTDSTEIDSRWWVMKHERIAGTQYRLYLRRDVLADYLIYITQNPSAYVVRGWCEDSDSAIFNKENYTCNQVKQRQIPLYDKTGCPWIVLYLKQPGITKVTPYPDKPETFYYKINTDAVNGLYNCTDLRFLVGEAKSGVAAPAFGVYWEESETTSQSFALQLSNATPYIALTLPYTGVSFFSGDTLLGTLTKEQVMRVMSNLQNLLGEWIMDMQMLPFCPFDMNPVESTTSGNIVLDVTKYISTGCVPLFKSVSETSSFETDVIAFIPQSPSLSRTDFDMCSARNEPISYSTTDLKGSFNCFKYRLCSPSYDSIWDFSMAELVQKSKEKLYFKADMTCQPYRAYVNVYPVMGRLYGKTFQDYRGLIAAGDYSLPQTSSAWIEYENNNKTYLKSFNREVDTLELEQKTERMNDIGNVALSTAKGIGAGASVGAAVGPVGAVVGAAVGAVAGAASGVYDLVQNDKLRENEMSEKIDQFNMRNQAIGAQPTTIGNVNTFNIDNLYVPSLEVYGPTTEEQQNYLNMIAQKGYSICRYGYLFNYMKPNTKWFYQVLLKRIRANTFKAIIEDGGTTYETIEVPFVGDSEMANAIREEASRGFYYTYVKEATT